MRRRVRSLEANATTPPVVREDTWGPIRIIPDQDTRDAWRPIHTRPQDADAERNGEEDPSD